MLKEIRVTQLRLGMHLQRLGGAPFKHGKWPSKLVLNIQADLDKVRSSGAEWCWIDTSKGLDVDSQLRPEPRVPPALLARSAPAASSLVDEVRHAATLVNQSRQAVADLFSQAQTGRALDASGCLGLVDDIAASVGRHPDALVGLARLKTHEGYACMHSVAVCALMVSLARQMGFDGEMIRAAGMAGLLHDMGKALMPESVLNKPGKLTAEEFGIMKAHPVRGYELLREGHTASDISLDVCLHHHERVDGSGYPHGLRGEEISQMAKMGAVCDVYDAITSNRPYKSGWDPAESIRKMAEWRGGHFDDQVFQAFVRCVGIYPAGSLVRLHSARLAVVVEQNPQSLVAPIVKVFYSTRAQLHIKPELLDLGSSGCNDRIVARESNGQWGFTHLDQLWAGPEALQHMGFVGASG